MGRVHAMRVRFPLLIPSGGLAEDGAHYVGIDGSGGYRIHPYAEPGQLAAAMVSIRTAPFEVS